jgi:hypothetical protein
LFDRSRDFFRAQQRFGLVGKRITEFKGFASPPGIKSRLKITNDALEFAPIRRVGQ